MTSTSEPLPGFHSHVLREATFKSTRLHRAIELSIIALVMVVLYVPGLNDVSFQPDESSWISTGAYFDAFVHGDFKSRVWEPTGLTLSLGRFAQYMLGMGMTLGGYNLSDLNAAWDYTLPDAPNVAAHHMPSPGLLWWSRLVMALLAVPTALLLFSVVESYGGQLTAYLFIALFAASGYLAQQLRHAMGESPLLFGVALAMWAADRTMVTWQQARAHPGSSRHERLRVALWIACIAIGSGLAGSAKLNGLLIALAGAAVVFACAFAFRSKSDVRRSLSVGLAAALAVCAGAWLLFVAFDPYLYPDPVGRTIGLGFFRLDLIAEQQAIAPHVRLVSLDEHINAIASNLFQKYATLRGPGKLTGLVSVLNVLLWAAGIFATGRLVRRWVRGERQQGGAAVVITLFACAGTIPELMTPLNWDRYFLLAVMFSNIFVAAGAAMCLRAVAHRLHHRRQTAAAVA